MIDPNQPDLLGYLAGALEPDERHAVEQALGQDPSLRNELRRVRRQLEEIQNADFGCTDLDDPQHIPDPISADFETAEWDSPSPGLADRTLQFIAQQRDLIESAESPRVELASGPSWRGRASRRSVARRSNGAREPLASGAAAWRFVDFAVALSVCLALATLVLPMVNASLSKARITACANNQREIGVALTQYSEHQNGFFPRVAESGTLAAGGIYAPTLLGAGYVTDPRVFVCPASAIADDPSLRIPTLAELEAATPDEMVQLRRQMGGSYGYALGYRESGVYRPTRNLYRDSFALVADMPSEDCASSPNHAGNGHNVLLEDGQVVFLKSCRLIGSTDDIFTNDEGKAAAGCHINDAVVVRSDVSP
ncbi:MAG TPA: hypothetical protein VHX65_03915 [Pirellulales bacterium]|jgi:hypothetical protein|nr:hypothetical protein [Pirellulales bacterium]